MVTKSYMFSLETGKFALQLASVFLAFIRFFFLTVSEASEEVSEQVELPVCVSAAP